MYNYLECNTVVGVKHNWLTYKSTPGICYLSVNPLNIMQQLRQHYFELDCFLKPLTVQQGSLGNRLWVSTPAEAGNIKNMMLVVLLYL